MKFTSIVSAAVLLASAASAAFINGTTSTIEYEATTTEVVTAYTTYCPYSTTFVENNKTYTVTEATTLTITNCPCTRTSVYTTSTVTVCPPSSKSVLPSASASVSSSSNVTTEHITATKTKTKHITPTGNATTTTPPIHTFTGAANKAGIASGAVAGVLAVAAYLL
ncbi:hypothetical protein V1514DRAFT_333763 [Lipomyces japonicus]|uniref:uncharacterized protein n=1 Tax=Lipomyces japonicus TaxID=56871 RepID=UPI0034CD3EC0